MTDSGPGPTLAAAIVFDVGSTINGKYRVVRLLGDGGMGSVFEAEHLALGTRVAIKVLHPELVRRPGLVERLLREARVAAQIRGQHVVQVFDVDRTVDGNAYIVMELLAGEPLSSVLDRQGKLPVPIACEYTTQVLRALEAAHALGVIHRDLKPDNVFVTPVGGESTVKLIDFGIAKARATDPQQKALTVAGTVLGTVEYMAPEQARGAEEVDARADIYAVGVMLYEMIAGARPVAGEDPLVVALRVERGDVVPLLKAAPLTPAPIVALVHRAMAARPELRFATATEMRLALQGAIGGRSPEPPLHLGATVTAMAPPVYGAQIAPLVSASKGQRPRRRRGALIALIALPLLLIAGIAGALFATGTWAFDPTPGSVAPLPASSAAAPVRPPLSAAPPPVAPPTEIPELVTAAPSRTPQRPPPPSRPQPSTGTDPGFLPFGIPSGLPTAFPSFPGVPPLPPGFPSALPSGFPNILAPWPTSGELRQDARDAK